MKKTFLLLTCFVLFGAIAFAGGNPIKERMRQRLPAIMGMKDQGLIGENNRGYLEYRSSNRPNQQVVNAENTDRRQVYQMIAQKTGSSPEIVGKQRAAQIAKRAPKGHWLQAPDGRWYRK
ncbi:MAG: YdbL family protein [Acidobacteria bacterium]|nr:YdbL family protein [Acidobacteriota bacterium]